MRVRKVTSRTVISEETIIPTTIPSNDCEESMYSLTTLIRHRPALVIAVIVVVILTTSAFIICGYHIHLHRHGEPEVTTEYTLPTTAESIYYTGDTSIAPDSYEYISRSEYQAQPPKVDLVSLKLPVSRVIIAHTATQNCTDFESCSTSILNIQYDHTNNKGFDDIGINFLVGGDGRAYEGRGYNIGAHTKDPYDSNSKSICISFIGNFKEYNAPERQLAAAQRLIEDGITASNIDPEYVLYGQIQLNTYDSPGLYLYNQIKSWPHWSNRVPSSAAEETMESTPHDTDEPNNYEYISRSEYHALPPKKQLVSLNLPIKRVIIAHTATRNCTDFELCSSAVLSIQYEHMHSKGWDDIGLNFLVGGDGRAYEGRGYNVGAHTKEYNSNSMSICISFIGNFNEYKATEHQIVAAQTIINEGILINKIDPEYVLYGQTQLNNNLSPGLYLYNQIKTWLHWSEELPS